MDDEHDEAADEVEIWMSRWKPPLMMKNIRAATKTAVTPTGNQKASFMTWAMVFDWMSVAPQFWMNRRMATAAPAWRQPRPWAI